MINKIKDYKLNTNINEYSSELITPFSASSYKNWESFGIRRLFKNEKFYWANDNILNGLEYEAIIATINNIIYKICFRLNELDINTLKESFTKLYNLISSKMGSKYELYEQDDIRVFLWPSLNGNVILEISPYHTAIILTSSYVKSARKRNIIDKLFNK